MGGLLLPKHSFPFRAECGSQDDIARSPYENETGTMSAFKNDDDFNERLSTAAKARQALLEKFRARPKPDDPAAAERQAARLATSRARDARIAERKAAREAEAARLQAEAVRQAAEEAARTAAAEVEQAVRDAALEAERKAARDARYAARKARR
jgi:Family of unknown function (DUF6481)